MSDEVQKCPCGTYLIEGETDRCGDCVGEDRAEENLMFFTAAKYSCSSCSAVLTEAEVGNNGDVCPECGDETLSDWSPGNIPGL